MPVKVSIVIPVYNTEQLLPRCLQSVVSQSLAEIEIICVDDGSTDGSARVLDEWATRDSRIVVIKQSNGRQGKARNTAMRVAQGEYIGMVDSDDYIPHNYFESLYNAAVEADADIAVCGIIKEKKISTRTVIAYNKSVVETTAEGKMRCCNCPPDFHPVNKLYRRAMLQRIALQFDEEVQYEDVMFITRALCESNRLVTVPSTTYRYVLNMQSTVKSRQTRQKQLHKYNAHKSMVDYVTQHNITIAPRYRHITVWQCTLAGVCLCKIKEYGNRRTLKLFDLLPLWSRHI